MTTEPVQFTEEDLHPPEPDPRDELAPRRAAKEQREIMELWDEPSD